MDKNRIIALKSSFDGISNSVVEAHIEFWYARDLMGLLGYTRWKNFAEAIKRAETSCSSNNIDISFHFREVTKMINLPKAPDIRNLERSVRRQDKKIANQGAAHLPPPSCEK